jgi:uncharacterized protein
VNILKYIKLKFKHHFKEVIRSKTSSHSIALGFSIGTFIGILPTPGFNILLGMLVILILKKISKFSLIGAMVLWNPLTLAPIYFLSLKIGNFLFGDMPIVKYDLLILDQIYHFSRRFLVGNILIAVAASLLSYFIVKKIVDLHRKKKKR